MAWNEKRATVTRETHAVRRQSKLAGSSPQSRSHLTDKKPAVPAGIKDDAMSASNHACYVEAPSSGKILLKITRTSAAVPPPKRTVKKNTSIECPKCKKVYASKKSLKVHTRQHTGEKPYKCSQCGMSFSQSNVLKAHMTSHSGERAFKCSFCPKSFKQSSHRRTHELIHTKTGKTYTCDVCYSTFGSKGVLDRHYRRHTGEKPYQCKICKVTFTRFESAQFHEKHHTEVAPNGPPLPWICTYPDCHNRYTKKCSLTRHMKTHHKTEQWDYDADSGTDWKNDHTGDIQHLDASEVEAYLEEMSSSAGSWSADSPVELGVYGDNVSIMQCISDLIGQTPDLIDEFLPSNPAMKTEEFIDCSAGVNTCTSWGTYSGLAWSA